MNNKKFLFAFKHIVYTLLLLLLYVIQTTPGLFSIFGARPLWVLPAAVAIAMFEGEFVGGIYGAAAGLLCDMSTVPRVGGGGALLFGFNGFLLCLFCVAAGLLVIYMLRCNLLGCMLFVAVVALARGSLEYLFTYGMWAHDDGWILYAYHTLPAALYTLLVTPLLFWLFRGVRTKFEEALKR